MIKTKHFEEIYYEKYLIIFSIIPLILWSIIIYIFWWSDRKNRFRYGKLILFPILWPYIYTFVTTIPDITNVKRLPVNLSWPICANINIPKKDNVYINWNWKCRSDQYNKLIDYLGDVSHIMYLVGYLLLLLMIVTTAISKRTLDNDILRNFASILVSLGFLVFAFMWLNTSHLYSLITYKILTIILAMGVSSIMIVIMAFGSTLY